jgi:hypothetical protein
MRSCSSTPFLKHADRTRYRDDSLRRSRSADSPRAGRTLARACPAPTWNDVVLAEEFRFALAESRGGLHIRSEAAFDWLLSICCPRRAAARWAGQVDRSASRTPYIAHNATVSASGLAGSGQPRAATRASSRQLSSKLWNKCRRERPVRARARSAASTLSARGAPARARSSL